MNLASKYLNQLVYYGGIPTPRYKVIQHLEKIGANQRTIGSYMFNLEEVEEGK